MASLLPSHHSSARIKDIHLQDNYGYGLSKRSPLPSSFLLVFSRLALNGLAVVLVVFFIFFYNFKTSKAEG